MTIEYGTKILAKKNPSRCEFSALVIARGANINAVGCVDSPIVFTSDQKRSRAGDWAGLVLLGKGFVSTSEEVEFPGEFLAPFFPDEKKYYGGGGCNTDDEDFSGVLQFIRIEYAGSKQAGIVAIGVGNKTMIESVEVAVSGSNSYAFLGGAVGNNRMLAFGSKLNDFYYERGYQACNTQQVAIRVTMVGPGEDRNSIYARSTYWKATSKYARRTLLRTKNATLIGYDTELGTPALGSAILNANGATTRMYNTVATGFKNAVEVKQGNRNAPDFCPYVVEDIACDSILPFIESMHLVVADTPETKIAKSNFLSDVQLAKWIAGGFNGGGFNQQGGGLNIRIPYGVERADIRALKAADNYNSVGTATIGAGRVPWNFLDEEWVRRDFSQY